MNVLFRLKKTTPLVESVPLKSLIYFALLSDVFKEPSEEVIYATSRLSVEDICDRFSDWEDAEETLYELVDEGLVLLGEDGTLAVGEFNGRKIVLFEPRGSSMFDVAVDRLTRAITDYGSSGSAKDRSRSRFIQENVAEFLSTGIQNLRPSDLTEIHGYLYEVYTGGEVYILRNKAEHFQTTNMLKAYDKQTVFAILVEGTLNYESYSKRGVPTITNVAMLKDEVFKVLSGVTKVGKEYMRDKSSTIDYGGF